MSKAECLQFIEKGEQVTFEEAKINMGGRQVMAKGVRNNQRVLFKDEQLAQSVWEKIQPMVPQTFGIYKAIGLNELV